MIDLEISFRVRGSNLMTNGSAEFMDIKVRRHPGIFLGATLELGTSLPDEGDETSGRFAVVNADGHGYSVTWNDHRAEGQS
jgi:hypothetical protein